VWILIYIYLIKLQYVLHIYETQISSISRRIWSLKKYTYPWKVLLFFCDIWGKSEKYTIFELIYQFSNIKLHFIENNCREHINRIKNNCPSKIIPVALHGTALKWNAEKKINLKKKYMLECTIFYLYLTFIDDVLCYQNNSSLNTS
jgi:hypothetical protein